jgi:hypothetical protein
MSARKTRIMSRQIISLDLAIPNHTEAGVPAKDTALQLELAIARERAIEWLVAQRLEDRRSADGRCVGIQATLATGPDGDNPIELYSILDGVVADEESGEGDDVWREIGEAVREKLGFPLEPELFSNMMFTAYLGDSDHPELQRISRTLLKTFRASDAGGLYHFFTSLRFACDVDCTGMAARARLACGDLDLRKVAGIRELRRITHGILRSAAIADVPAEKNRTHGKDNGPLRKHVLKVYLDDHEVQGRTTDRGLKNNPAVVANALFPLLLELRDGLRRPDEVVPLREYVEGSDVSHRGEATVGEILAANVCYATGYLLSGEWRGGCRYYPSPDAFLCFFSELVHEFPELFAAFGARDALRDAIAERRAEVDDGPFSARRPLNLALRAIAAQNAGMSAKLELRKLIALQASDGSWPGFDCLYTLGTTSSQMPVHFGSTLMTASLCVRALSPRRAPPQPARPLRWAQPIIEQVLRKTL